MYENIALLEYDNNQSAIIDPDHENFDMHLPEVAVYAFAGEVIDEYAQKMHAKVVGKFYSITKNYPVYVLNHNGKEICIVQAPCGAAPAVQIMDWLIGYGVKKVISTGSCGVLKDIPENEFLIVNRALRDEGTSFHYLHASRYIDLNPVTTAAIERYFTTHNIPYELCTTWTTDGFFRETKQKVTNRKAEGCTAVDMECSALAACAEFRQVEFGQFFFTADSLHNLDDYAEREWGADALEPAFALALDIAAAL